jgi:hypothetical protein
MIEMSLRQSEPVALPEQPTGGSWRSVLAHVLVTTLMIVTGLLVFVPAALFHCGLRSGRRAAWLTGIVAMAIAAFFVGAVPAPDANQTRMAWAELAAFGLAVVLPSLLALPLVEQGVRFGRLLALLLLGSTIGLAAVELGSRALTSFSPFAFHSAQAKQGGAMMLEFYRKSGIPPEGMRAMERWFGYWSENLLPGLMLVMLAMIFVLSLLMLGRLKTWRDRVARSANPIESAGAYLFRNFAVPDWVLLAFIAGGLTPLTTGLLHKVAANALFLAVFLYLLQGLAVFRYVLAAIGGGFAGAMLGWMLLAFLMLTMIGPLVLGLAGLFDPFFDFRHYKKRKDDSHESHSD